MLHSIKKKSDLPKNIHFGVKNRFSRILKFLRICWSDLVDSIGFLKAVDMDLLLILSRTDFKGPLDAIIIFNLERITFSVKQRENTYADP